MISAGASGRWWLPVLCLAIALMTTACSLPRRYYPVETESIRDLPVLERQVKRIGVCRFSGGSGPEQKAIAAQFENDMAAALGRNCGKVAVVRADAVDAPQVLMQTPVLENGREDQFALSQAARRMGFQIIVKGRLLSLRHRIDRSGWARFRKSNHYLDLQLEAAAIDAATAAKIEQHSERITLPIDEQTGTAIDAGGGFQLPELVEAVEEAGIDLALKLCIAVRRHHWQSVIADVRGQEMILAAHPSAGLAAGDRLAVFDGRRVFDGGGGDRFVLPGFRLGTLIVTGISEATGDVMATGEDDAVFPAGSILVPVR